MSSFDKPFEVGPLKFSALGDRVIIREDEFKSGYECQTCGGSGTIKCDNCSGTGHYSRGGPELTCAQCNEGKLRCSACEGKGGLIAIPETSQRRPTTGIIVSAGDSVQTVKVGDQVMYSNFAGYVVDLAPTGEQITLRLLHENEILCRIEGHLELRTLRGKSEIATFS